VVYDALIFDLDGTLWDAAVASTYGWNLALQELGLPHQVTVDGIRSVSGMPFRSCVEMLLPELHPASAGLLDTLEAKERVGIETIAGELYEGVAEGLETLAAVYPLFVVSNCPDWYLEEFFRFSGLGRHFSGYDCHGMSRSGKADMLMQMVRSRGLSGPIYVGDTQGDRDAAEAAGVDFALAGYGFGASEGVGLVFSSFGELVDHFMGVRSG
jgi:phosphoglycolate phosphatase